jgi:FkbM family methyltransferase
VAPLRRSALANFARWTLDFRGQRRAIGRGYIFDALSHVTPSVAVDTDGLCLYLSTADREVSRGTFVNGAYDRPLLERAVALLERQGLGADLEGRGFLDVGANIGTASCLALRFHGARHAWAFEPAPENVRLLRQNVVANGFEESMTVHACALSDCDGPVLLELSEANSGDNRVRTAAATESPGLIGEAGWPTVEVPARRLDALIEEGALDPAAIGLAWIDAQGHEAQVLAGARRLLEARVPIVCELWPYGLRRAGGLERFCELIAGSRAEFVDLGRPGSEARPTTGLRDLAGTFKGMLFTDLLLLPAPSSGRR